MREVVIVDGVRSAFTNFGGGLRTLASVDIASRVVDGLLEKTGILERGTVDSLIAGCALGDYKCKDIARYVVLQSKLPTETSGTFVEMQCGSAITSLNHAAWKIMAGMSDVAIVGGMESYSTMTAKFPMSKPQYKLIPPYPIAQGLTPNKERNVDMITVSDKMAVKWNVKREEADAYAARSQQRLQRAYERGVTGTIIPITIPGDRKRPDTVVDKDEFPRPETTLEGLAKLRAVHPDGVTTAGNASGRNDGAAFLLVMTAEKAKEYGYTPIARWVTGAHCGVQEDYMGIGPAFSNLKAMKAAGLKIGDVDVYECNEAFAAQNLSVIREMEAQTGDTIDQEKWNPNGGAISIGHPNGASGARITIFAMNELLRTGGKYGVISSCCGGGLGTTAIIENLKR
ncbi:MAG TPA: thiolase family protein [Candidatus Galloscillospira stercoripullorum]|nr:thiolase family protein [Candidatus Galloscillospira stercoripullorum]